MSSTAQVPQGDVFSQVSGQPQASPVQPAQGGGDIFDQLKAGGGEVKPAPLTPEQQRAKQESDASQNRMNALSGMTGMPNPGMNAEDRKQFEEGKKTGTIDALKTIPTVIAGTGVAQAARAGLAKLGETEAIQLLKSSPRLYAEYILKHDIVPKAGEIAMDAGKMALKGAAAYLGFKWLGKML